MNIREGPDHSGQLIEVALADKTNQPGSIFDLVPYFFREVSRNGLFFNR